MTVNPLHPTEDSSLYISLSHAIPSYTMKILSSDTSTKSEVMILLNLQSKVLILKTTDSVDKMYGQWCGIKRDGKESVEVYTARALPFQSELKGTIKDFAKEEIVQKRRQGMGKEMDDINTTLDNLQISLLQWSYVHPMFQLMEEAKQIVSTIKNDNIKNIVSFTKDRGMKKRQE